MSQVFDDQQWRDEQRMLWCLSAYAVHLNRSLEFWEIDAILAVDTQE